MFSRKERAKRKPLPPLCLGLLIGLAAAALTCLVGGIFSLDRVESALFDQRLRWRPSVVWHNDRVKVLIVAVDEKTLGIGEYQQWPLPRSAYVPLVRLMQKTGARCTGFDLRFEDRDPGEDQKLAAAMRRAGNVYLGVRFDPQTAPLTPATDLAHTVLDRSRLGMEAVSNSGTNIVMKGAALPPRSLSDTARNLGSITILPEVDGVVRRFPLVTPYVRPGAPHGPVHLYASLPLLMAADILKVPLNKVRVRLGECVEIGSHRIPINESGEMVINYYGGYRSLYHLSLVDVVRGVYPPSCFHDKAVILGNTASGGFDIQITPYGGQYPGVEAQATVLQNILDGTVIKPAFPWVNCFFLLAAALTVGAARARKLPFQCGVFAAVMLGVILVSYWLLAAHAVWIELARPLLAVILAFAGITLSTFLEAQAEQARVQGAVDALAEVSQALVYAHQPAELLPALEKGLARVLNRDRVQLLVKDAWLREQLLPGVSAEASSYSTAVPILLRGKSVGQLALPPAGKADDPDLLTAATTFAALALEDTALQEETRDYFFNLTMMLAEMIESKDHYTAGHCSRVMQYAGAIGAKLGLSSEAMDELRYAALLHDVGKIGVAEAILNKPGALTPAEHEEMHRHPELGRQWLHRERRLRGISELVAAHHEYWNGTGYPAGLSGDAIPLGSRIVAVADVWDALTSDRPYRAAMGADAARRIIEQGAGRQFDPRVASVFLALLDET
ncbi:MAG TPA: CHASE2 domain-containing protein [Armatimonadota bacterium]|nr:CHASE2 domain-containing protein [Armatimonadota bacterium]